MNNELPKSIGNRPGNDKDICAECGGLIDPKWEGIDLCAKCDEKNWITDPKEIIETLNKDPKFKIGYESPYYKKP